MLRMVLKHQNDVVDAMKEILSRKGVTQWEENRVSAAHDHRIQTMEKLVENTKDSVSSISTYASVRLFFISNE